MGKKVGMISKDYEGHSFPADGNLTVKLVEQETGTFPSLFQFILSLRNE